MAGISQQSQAVGHETTGHFHGQYYGAGYDAELELAGYRQPPALSMTCQYYPPLILGQLLIWEAKILINYIRFLLTYTTILS
jgi:hypothetical protein